jgi:hypothetical protein
MKITGELLTFPFKDEKWIGKILIGMLLGMAGILVFPLLWPLTGMGIRVMRQTMQGQAPAMPEWDDWGELFKDGLRYWGVMVIYGLPLWVLIGPAYGLLGYGVYLFIRGIDDPALFFQAMMFWMAGMGLSTLAFIPGVFLGFLGTIAVTRMVANDSFRSAFELKEVWALMRRGFKHYAIAMVIFYAIIMGMSMAASILTSTIVLSCLYPFLLGIAALLGRLLMGTLFGMAYYETTGGVAAQEVEAAPALA